MPRFVEPEVASDRVVARGDRQTTALIRQWRILRILETRPRNLREVARAIGVMKDQVKRDLVVLERAGFPVFMYQDDFGHRWWGTLRRAPARHEQNLGGGQ